MITKEALWQLCSQGPVLLDGATGERLDMINLERTVEASPVVFGNKIVMGSRASMYIFEVR